MFSEGDSHFLPARPLLKTYSSFNAFIASRILVAFITFSIEFRTTHLLKRLSLIFFVVRPYSASNTLYASLRTTFGLGGLVGDLPGFHGVNHIILFDV